MSFLKISDPKKRDLIVEEFLKIKKNTHEIFLSEKLGDIIIQREMSRVFRPITEAQKDVKESLLGELKPIEENLKELPAITFPQLQAITAPPEDEEDEDEDVMRVGKIAHQFLSDYAAKQNVDTPFGIYKNSLDKQYYIGNKPVVTI